LPKRNAKYSEKSNESGKVDEAETIQEVAGAKTAAFGLAIDSVGRSNPTHMLPLHVRQTLARWWSNIPGHGVNGFPSGAGTLHDVLLKPEHLDANGNYQNLQYSWYEPSIDGSIGPMDTTVAAQLAVTVGEAEQLVNGTPDGGNSFLEYCDVPMNQQTLDRLSYWAYDQSAIEFDPNYQFEAQMVGVDAFSQLFVECMDFHFHFLAVLDQEYHRLRNAGPLGVMDDSRHTSSWYHQYHFWRDEIEAAYLETGAVELPTGLRGANWTIADVLTEILRMMVGADGSLLPDIKLSLKGLVKAKSGSSLGIYTDPSMLDADGNVRFYQPAWRTESIAARGKGKTPVVVGGDRAVGYPYVDVGPDDFANDVDITFAAPYEGEGSDVVSQSASTVYWDNQIQSFAPTLEVVAAQGRLPRWARADADVPTSGLDPTVLSSTTYWTTAHSRPQMYFCDLPQADGVLSGRDGQGNVAYWRGDQLNLVDMIAVARRLGRVLEPEVCNGFLPGMGMVTGMDQLLSQPMSLNARMYDELINLYTSSFMYNENPVRTYTAAHLGPIDRGVSSGELNVGDHQLHTEETAEDGSTTVLTVREKYWTPPTIQGAQAKAETLAFFVPNGVMESDLIGNISLTTANEFLDHVDPVLFGRLFGNTNSMLTKVERPIVLPAGVAEPESTYASGMGIGAVQMLVELQASVFGGEPYVGLGHNGFIDWQVDRSLDADQPARHFPLNRAAMTQGTYQGYTLYQGPMSEDGNMEVEGLYNYTAAEAIASRTLAFIGLDPLGISLAADFLLDDIHDVGNEKAMSLWPVGCDGFNSDAISGMTTRISSETASVAQFNILRNSIPSDLQWGMFGLESSNLPVGNAQHVDMNGNPSWCLFYPSNLSNYASVAGGVLDQGVTSGYLARVPQSITYTKGGTSHTVNLGYTAADLIGTANSKLFGPGNLFSKTLANGLKVWEGTDTTLPFVTDDGAGTAVVENILMREFDAGTGLPSTSNKMHTSLLQLNLTPHDMALAHFQDIPYDVQSALLSGTNTMDISFDIELMALGISFHDGDQESPTFHSAGFEPESHDEYSLVVECGVEDAFNMFGQNIANGTFPEYHRDFRLTWDNRERDVSDDVKIDISFDRDQIASETVKRHATLRSVSRSVMTPVQDNNALFTAMGNGSIVGMVPLGLSTDTELTAAANWISMIDTIHAVAYNPRESPGGAWGNMNIDIDSKRTISTANSAGAFPMGPWVVNSATLNNAVNNASVAWQVAMLAKYSTCATWRTFFDADFGIDIQNISYNYLYFGVNREADFWSTWGDVGFDSYHGSSTVWHYYPATWGDSTSLAAWGAAGERGMDRVPTSSVTLCAGNPSSVSYVIPDDPDHRMIYRPYRTLVDAAVAKELKQLLVPTHERYDGVGGPLGLPFYGTTTPFRFSQLAFDANLPDQFLLEPAASKARMINSANRGMLTFGKLALLDTDTQRHVISPILREMNNAVYMRGQVHAGGVTGSPVYTRDLIRDIQYGRQLQNL